MGIDETVVSVPLRRSWEVAETGRRYGRAGSLPLLPAHPH